MRTKNLIITGIFAIIFSGCSIRPTIASLKTFAAIEEFANDTYLDTVLNKTALIIVAHDDDNCAFSGSLAKLHDNDWRMKQLSFELTVLEEGRKEHPSLIICDGIETIPNDGVFRLGRDTMKSGYMPIPISQMNKEFLTEKITNSIIEKINYYRPSVIFTLDNEIGGYGHPEHVYLSQLVIDICKREQTTVKRIYQAVYTDHMEEEIINKWSHEKIKKYGYPDPYQEGKKVYDVSGMPEPNVQINIEKYADVKMKYLMAYHEDARKNMRKFIPYFEEFDAKTYFSIFDREFFRIIETMPTR